MVRLDRAIREYLPVPDEEEPCVTLEELFEIWSKIVIPRYSKVLEERVPEVRRYRPYVAHRLDNFEKAVKAWLIGLSRSRYPGVGLWEGIFEVFGYRHPYFYYYMRWLGFIATSRDIRSVFGVRLRTRELKKLKMVEEGYLYVLTKVYVTGSYEEKYGFSYQIECALTPVLEYREDERKICIDFDYVKELLFNALNASQLDDNFVDVLETYYDVFGIKFDFTAWSWDFERFKTARYCYLGVQKQNLYGSYWIYEYYIWFLRKPYPETDVEWVSNLHGGAVRFGVDWKCFTVPEALASTVLDADGKKWVEEEAEEVIQSYRRRQEEEAEILKYVYEKGG